MKNIEISKEKVNMNYGRQSPLQAFPLNGPQNNLQAQNLRFGKV